MVRTTKKEQEMKQFHLFGNLKMNLNTQELNSYLPKLAQVANQTNHVVGVCVPFVYLPQTSQALKGSKALFGVQNIHPANSGAFTGEISTSMASEFGAKLVIVGHSERRALFLESNQFVNQKLLKVLESGLTPILCVGETLNQRNEGKTFDVIREQLTQGLDGVNKDQLNHLYIAYEPVWAIGTGVSATSSDAENGVKFIKDELTKLYGKRQVKVLYGGSLNEKNAKELLSQPSIDGGLIGGASLKMETFEQIISTQI